MAQTACDRCTQGVMDQDNPHLHNACGCRCHQTDLFPADIYTDQGWQDEINFEACEAFGKSLAEEGY